MAEDVTISSETVAALRERSADSAVNGPSPAAAAPRRLRGTLDLVRHDVIEGWAFNPETPEAAMIVAVLVNGAEIARVVADNYREDLEAAGVGNGAHAFRYAIAGGLACGEPVSVEACHAGDGTPLEGSPALLEPAPTGAAALGELRGELDGVGHDRVAGWAQDTADPERAVGLVVSANGEVLGRVLANRYRDDLADVGLGSGRHAFDLVLPGTLSALEDQEIRVAREADGAELPGSPVLLPAARGFDAPVRQMLHARLGYLAAGAEEDEALLFLTQETDRLLARRAARESGAAARDALRLHRRRWGRAAVQDGPAARLRALVVDDRAPVAGRDAGSVAVLSHILALQALGYEVSFVAASEIGERCEALDAAGVSLCAAPYYSCVEDVLFRQAGTFDLVYLHRLSNAETYVSLARRHQPKARIVYGVADLHHLRLARQAEVEKRPELMMHSRRLAAREMMAAHRADLVLTHSPVEAALLRREINPAKIHVVPFAVAAGRERPPLAERHGIAFIGGFEHAPNPDAVHHLVHDILPLVWARDATLACAIVGFGWSPERLPGLDSRVAMMGPVSDLDALFDRVRLTVAPLRFGAGIKGKVLTSFAAGLPCVMTPVAAEGLPLTARLRDLVADTPAALAERILHYHADAASNRDAASEAARLVATRFSQQSVAQSLETALAPPTPNRSPTPAQPGEPGIDR